MKYEAEDVQAIARAAVQMVKEYVDGTGMFPAGENLSGMIDAALRTTPPSRRPKWGIDNLRLLFDDIKANAADLAKSTNFPAAMVLKAQEIVLQGLLSEQGFRPMSVLLPAILATVNGDRFHEFCELLRQA
jgi:hypothetical protein